MKSLLSVVQHFSQKCNLLKNLIEKLEKYIQETDKFMDFKFLVILFQLYLKTDNESLFPAMSKISGRLFMNNQARSRTVKLRNNSGLSSRPGQTSLSDTDKNPKLVEV